MLSNFLTFELNLDLLSEELTTLTQLAVHAVDALLSRLEINRTSTTSALTKSCDSKVHLSRPCGQLTIFLVGRTL